MARKKSSHQGQESEHRAASDVRLERSPLIKEKKTEHRAASDVRQERSPLIKDRKSEHRAATGLWVEECRQGNA